MSWSLWSSSSMNSKGINHFSFAQKQTVACLTSDLSFSWCHRWCHSLSPSHSLPLFQSLVSSPHPAKRSNGRKKWWGGGRGWRGLASLHRPPPQGLPHPAFRSHPSHLFLSVFPYLNRSFFPISLSLSSFFAFAAEFLPGHLSSTVVIHKKF